MLKYHDNSSVKDQGLCPGDYPKGSGVVPASIIRAKPLFFALR